MKLLLHFCPYDTYMLLLKEINYIMSAPDYDELLPNAPFLARLIRKVNATPTAEDLAAMKKVDVQQLRIFFDSGSQGLSDKDTYQEILDYLHGRESSVSKRMAEAEKKKKLAEQKRREAEEAEKRKRAQQKEATAAPAPASKEVPQDSRICSHCKAPIQDEQYLENDGMFLHSNCLEAWQESNCPKCAQCQRGITGEYVVLTANGAEQHLHPECVDAFKEKVRPLCSACNKKIMENKYMKLDDKFYHEKCAPTKK